MLCIHIPLVKLFVINKPRAVCLAGHFTCPVEHLICLVGHSICLVGRFFASLGICIASLEDCFASLGSTNLLLGRSQFDTTKLSVCEFVPGLNLSS